jgi:hypothetical protein
VACSAIRTRTNCLCFSAFVEPFGVCLQEMACGRELARNVARRGVNIVGAEAWPERLGGDSQRGDHVNNPMAGGLARRQRRGPLAQLRTRLGPGGQKGGRH